MLGCGDKETSGGSSQAASSALSGSTSDSSGEKKASGEKFKVGFSMDFTTNVWRAVLLEKMEEAAAAHADEMDFVVTNANADSNKQISDVEDLLAQDIDLLIITPYVTEPLTPIIEEVYDQGIPVIVIDHESGSDKYTTFIGASNSQLEKPLWNCWTVRAT